ncbi:MAG: SlyX family protein [Magnetovibrio sp.]|nr:SlyX family protein [Magnetovibrio sp.]
MPADDTDADRLAELETRFVHTEQALQDLSDMTTEQWAAIDALKREVRRLKDQIATLEDRPGAAAPEDEKPPHY